MKKRLLFIIMLFGLILIPKGILAASLELSCPTSVTAGENITCTLNASHETISGVKGSLSFSGMSYQSVSNLTGSNYFSVSSSGFDGAIDIASGSKSLAKYVFTTNSPGTATISVSCSELIDGTNFDTHSCSGASKTITIKAKEILQPSNPIPQPSNPTPQPENNLSKNNNLKSLSIDGFELVKVDNNNYTLTVSNDITSINVNASAEDSKANVTGTGTKELQIGENNVEVIITSESGVQNKINIKITRKDGYYLEDLDSVLKNDKIQDADIIINADSKITKEQLGQIKTSSKKLRFNYFDEDKKLLYSWTINGKQIKDINEFATTIDFSSENLKEIYKVSNYADGLYINFKHNGDLPTGTKIKLYVGDKFENGNIVNVYRYNANEKKLDFVKDNLKVTDGYIEFDLEHCSDYFVTMSVIRNVVKEDSSINIFMILIIVSIIVIIGLVAFIFVKIRPLKKETNDIELPKTLESNNYNNNDSIQSFNDDVDNIKSTNNNVENNPNTNIDSLDNNVNGVQNSNIYSSNNDDNNLFNNNLNKMENINNNTNINNNENINNNNLY